MLWTLLFVPFLAGLASIFVGSDLLRRSLLLGSALCHAGIMAASWVVPVPPIMDGWFALDPLGRLFLSIASALFLMASFYAVGYLRSETRRHAGEEDEPQESIIPNAPESIFVACLLMFLTTMTVVTASQNFGLIWIAMEGTTLVTAPLIYFHRNHRSLEATWKYLLICSVGIAVSLLGNFFLAIAASNSEGVVLPLTRAALLAHGPELWPVWLKAAFIFILVGYGTKMGLAPMHTWLPDAHSEAPAVVSALLSGALLNCAFVGILRVFEVTSAAGLLAFSQDLLLLFGLVSMLVAAIFIIGQTDYKRMLAYSSVEHMGVLALGVGLGGAATFGAMLHAVNHSFTKGALFMLAGNLLAAYKTKVSSEVRGAVLLLPVSGLLWVAGILAISGFPPFGTFLSEFTILKASLDQGRHFVAFAYLALLALIFIGVSATAFRMAQGRPSIAAPAEPDRITSFLPPAILLTLVMALGLYVPAWLGDALRQVAQLLGGT